MLSAINNISFTPYRTNLNQKSKPNIQTKTTFEPSLSADVVNFTGKSVPSAYSTVFEYLASNILGANKRYHVNGSMLSASKITEAVENLINEGRVYLPFKYSVSDKIKWKSYIPKDVREGSIGKINEARVVRMGEWCDFLRGESLILKNGKLRDRELSSVISRNPSLKLVIWDAVSSELKENNRHLPVPFNEKALLETIKGFEKIEPMDRAVRCAAPSFLDIYTHRLRDNLLMDMGLSDRNSVWVKIPSIKHDYANKCSNIEKLEVLSCKNWCTRSSVDKAEAALEDGDFYIYLERGKFNLWEPKVGMTTLRGKIDQIQGVENNNIVPLGLVDEIKDFIARSGLKCNSDIVDEGPKASQAIMISEKLNEVDSGLKKSFAKAIKEDDAQSMFKFLGVNTSELSNGMLAIDGYRPSYSIKPESGISIPYSMFGLDEDVLLKNVEVINGDFVLHSKNSLFTSKIRQFPPNLKTVTGRITCSAQQYQQFEEDILRVVGNNKKRIRVRN